MRTISATTRIAVGLASITLTATILAWPLGLIPDRSRAVLEGRSRLCESTAIGFTMLAGQDHAEQFQAGLEAIVKRNSELLSAAIRLPDGEFVACVGNHEQRWNHADTKELPGAQMLVPIVQDDEPWGTIEFCFEPLTTGWWHDLWVTHGLRLPVFLAAVCGSGAWFYLRRMLRCLDPSKVVPTRVRQALDTLAEGLLLLDKDERIVLANRAFTTTAGVAEKQLLGRKASTLPWNLPGNETHAGELPWIKALRGEVAHNGTMLNLAPSQDESRTFMVNAVPIRDDQGRSQGALTSFSDVTPLEKKKSELAEMLNVLQNSAEEIHRQNQELERLATEDPLTGCRNRRSFFTAFEDAWNVARQSGQELSCVMVDLDHFKSVNDCFGHSTGDEVLRQVAATLRRLARDTDLVCRYGGEEFCVLMRETDVRTAMNGAERLRQGIAAIQRPKFAVTASFGVSSTPFGARSPQELLDQADKSLYAAKKSGRNCVVCFDSIPSDWDVDQAQTSRTNAAAGAREEQPIPFHAVAALMSALAFRDATTAEHSRRVADLCVLAAQGLMSPSQCYLLEIAALLHDIGKIGVPDAILLKAGSLTPQDQEVMRTHQSHGLELVRVSFKSPELCAILDNRATSASAVISHPKTGQPTRVPLGARILAIADSYDSMITKQIYRDARSPEEAFTELRRCAGTQFDPELVERFIACVRSQSASQLTPGTVSKEAAIAIGQHLEQLVSALDRRDLTSLRDIAGHMNLVATKQGALTIAQQAGHLESAIGSEESDLLAALHEADELLQLCRQTQRAFFEDLRPPQTRLSSVSDQRVSSRSQ